MGPISGPETSVRIRRTGFLAPEDGTDKWSRNVGKNPNDLIPDT